MAEPATGSRLAVLVFTDIVGSTELKSHIGNAAYARLLGRHDELFRQLINAVPAAQLLNDTGDGYFAAFASVADAVRFSLNFQQAMHDEKWEPRPLRTRIGIHVGDVAEIADKSGGRTKIVGMAADLAARITSIGHGGQILLTRVAFNDARLFIGAYSGEGDGKPLRWVAHGQYLFKGYDEAIEVFEVGAEGIAPLSPPAGNDDARRSVSAEQEQTLGWRPAMGLEVPQRVGWKLERKLGEGTFGEVWLATHQTTRQHRVFKFCFDADRLRSFKRELTLFRLLRDALGDRRDIASIYDVRLDHPPFFLEGEYATNGNLAEWAGPDGGLEKIPLSYRLEIVAKVADAAAAAHSVGVLHKDIKPSNILMHVEADGTIQPRLSDFGIGILTDRDQLAARHITEAGFTLVEGNESSRTGTRMYAPPESLTGRPFTIQGDIYALGVLLYQLAIADLNRPVAMGWERDITDELLREDIAACLEGDAQRRLPSATELALRLRQLPQRRRQRELEREQLEQARRRRRMLRVSVAIAAIVIVCIALAVYAYIQDQRVRASAREAQWSHATGTLAQGISLNADGRAQEARVALLEARDALKSLGVSTVPAEVALYRSLREYRVPINTITGHEDGVMGVAWLPDGIRVVSAAEDKTVRLWDARSGAQLRSFAGHTKAVLCIAVSPDGRRLLSGGEDQSIRVWDVETGGEVRNFREPSGEVRGVAFSRDGRFALSASRGSPGAVRLWEIERRVEARTYQTPSSESFSSVAFSPDGGRLLATTYDAGICVWETESGRMVRRLRDARDRAGQFIGHTNYVTSATFDPQGRTIVSACMDETIKVWDLESGAMLRTFKGHKAGVRNAVFLNRIGDVVVSSSMDGSIKAWDEPTGEVLRTFCGHAGGVRCVAISPDGTRAVSAGVDKTLRVWDVRPSTPAPTTREGSAITSLAASDDGAMFAVGEMSGVVSIHDRATMMTVQSFSGHRRAIECARILSDGRRVFSADEGGNAKVWDLASGREIRSFAGRSGVTADKRIRPSGWRYCCVARDGQFAISGDDDRKTLKVWSLDSGATLRTLGPCKEEVTAIALSDDDRLAFGGDGSGAIYLWDVTSGQCLLSTMLQPKPAPVDCVAFSADGKTALVGGHDMLVRVWDLDRRAQIHAFAGHTLIVKGVGFARDNHVIFSSSTDRTLRVWDRESQAEMNLAAELPVASYALGVIPPGDAVVVSSSAFVSLWDMNWPMRYLEAERGAESSMATLRRNSEDAKALAVMGQWYALHGVNDWAAALLEQARAGGADVSPLLLGRCYWQLDRRADAEREFRAALARREAPEDYLNLCLSAVAHPPSTAPSTAPALLIETR